MEKEECLDLLEEFKLMCPWISSMLVDWWPTDHDEIIAELSDGSAIMYDGILKTFRKAPSIDELYERLKPTNEERWRRNFATRLLHLMCDRGMTQMDLAYEAGISQSSVAQYLNCNMTPNTFNIIRIAEALNCTRKEFCYLVCFD